MTFGQVISKREENLVKMPLKTSSSFPCLCSTPSCQKEGPLNIGTSYISEKSMQFWKDPIGFFEKNISGEDRIFACRFGLRPCYIVADNALVKQMLDEHTSTDSYNGLKDFFFGLFGHSIMFAEAEEAATFRNILMPLMDPDSMKGCKSFTDDLLQSTILSLPTTGPVVLYDVFKRFATKFTLGTFLGVEGSEADEMAKLATTHWHGIISVPVSVKVTFFVSSSYRKAVEAKDRLLEMIGDKLAERGEKRPDFLSGFVGRMDFETAKNHVLLFTCALIPKAMASILTSAIDSSPLWYDNYARGEISIDDILLEVVRLWPPFFGGLRVANNDFDLGKYHVPAGYGVFCANLMAHRDPKVFPDPEKFDPGRWTTRNKGDKAKVFGFGSGPHKCVGEKLMWTVLKSATTAFVGNYNWTRGNAVDRDLKYLPVLRPRNLVPVVLEKKL